MWQPDQPFVVSCHGARHGLGLAESDSLVEETAWECLRIDVSLQWYRTLRQIRE